MLAKPTAGDATAYNLHQDSPKISLGRNVNLCQQLLGDVMYKKPIKTKSGGGGKGPKFHGNSCKPAAARATVNKRK